MIKKERKEVLFLHPDDLSLPCVRNPLLLKLVLHSQQTKFKWNKDIFQNVSLDILIQNL